MPLKVGLPRSRWNTIFPWEPKMVGEIDELKAYMAASKHLPALTSAKDNRSQNRLLLTDIALLNRSRQESL